MKFKSGDVVMVTNKLALGWGGYGVNLDTPMQVVGYEDGNVVLSAIDVYGDECKVVTSEQVVDLIEDAVFENGDIFIDNSFIVGSLSEIDSVEWGTYLLDEWDKYYLPDDWGNHPYEKFQKDAICGYADEVAKVVRSSSSIAEALANIATSQIALSPCATCVRQYMVNNDNEYCGWYEVPAGEQCNRYRKGSTAAKKVEEEILKRSLK